MGIQGLMKDDSSYYPLRTRKLIEEKTQYMHHFIHLYLFDLFTVRCSLHCLWQETSAMGCVVFIILSSSFSSSSLFQCPALCVVKTVGPLTGRSLVRIPELNRWNIFLVSLSKALNPNCSCKSLWIKASAKWLKRNLVMTLYCPLFWF
jgi:hypothetical protein